jgi:hypothetical protein
MQNQIGWHFVTWCVNARNLLQRIRMTTNDLNSLKWKRRQLFVTGKGRVRVIHNRGYNYKVILPANYCTLQVDPGAGSVSN